MLEKKFLFHFNKTAIFEIAQINLICFQSGMAIDADGCPTAYHPDNTGLDELKHGGYPGNWWGIATDDKTTGGNPIIQNEQDPAPGYYLSTTSLVNSEFQYRDSRRYVDARKVPYFVLPESFLSLIELGDVAWIFNRNNGLSSYAIFADVGPDVGEGSMHLANKIGINDDPKTGGLASGILYFILYGSGRGNGVHPSTNEIIKIGENAMQDILKSDLIEMFK